MNSSDMLLFTILCISYRHVCFLFCHDRLSFDFDAQLDFTLTQLNGFEYVSDWLSSMLLVLMASWLLLPYRALEIHLMKWTMTHLFSILQHTVKLLMLTTHRPQRR